MINKKDFKTIGPFKGWVLENFPFIEADFDAITSYQLWCKVVEYLNKVIYNEILLEESDNELIDAFNNLKTYVDNYFNNLDLQEEVDNKLDEMVEEGTLQEIVADYLNSKAIFGFDTVASMKLATNLINGSYAKTLGYYSKNDGGSALYKIRTITNDDIVDEEFIIALSDDSLIAELIVENNQVNILQIGAKNDNSTDVGALINYVINTKNYKCYVPTGDYKVDTMINPNGNKYLKIEGNLICTTNIEACIKINSTKNYIETNNITCTNAVCILLENNDTTAKCTNNIIKMLGTNTSDNNHALYLHSILQGICYNEITFGILRAKANTHYGIYIKTESENSSYPKFINENTFYGGRCSRGLYGIYIDTNTSGTNGEVNGLKFYNVALEGVTNGVYIKNARSNLFEAPRVGELTGHYFKFVNTPDSNFINILSILKTEKIDVSEMDQDNTVNNFINAQICTTGGVRFGKNLIASNRRLTLEHLIKDHIQKNITNNDITAGVDGNPNTFTMGNNNYENYLLFNSDMNPVVTLSQYYGSKGINDIYVYEVSSTKKFKLYDNYGTLIDDYDASSPAKRKHFICVNKNGNDTWEEV